MMLCVHFTILAQDSSALRAYAFLLWELMAIVINNNNNNNYTFILRSFHTINDQKRITKTKL